MTTARAYHLPLTAVLAWSAVDVIVAAWSIGRANTSADYAAHRVAFYGANLTAVAFHDPKGLKTEGDQLSGQRPAWERTAHPSAPASSWDDALAALARMR